MVRLVHERRVANLAVAGQSNCEEARSEPRGPGTQCVPHMFCATKSLNTYSAVTRSGVDLRFVVHDHRIKMNMLPHLAHSHSRHQQFRPSAFQSHTPAFAGQHGNRFQDQHLPPRMSQQPRLTYLFTSPAKESEATLREIPVYIPVVPGATSSEVRNMSCVSNG